MNAKNKGINTIQYDSLNQLRAAIGNKTILAEPNLCDLYIDGKTPAGVADDESVLYDWLNHIDLIIQKSIDESK